MTTNQAAVDSIRQICEHLPDSVVWVTPVFDFDSKADDETIVDFEFQYCNKASETITRTSAANLLGKRVLSDQLPDPHSVPVIFEQCLQVYQTGAPLEFTYLSTGLDKYLTLNRIKVHGGVLTTARNRTAEYQTNLEKEQQAKLLHSLVDHSPYGICLYESIRDQSGTITDFRLKIANRKSAEITALTMDQLYGKTVRELMELRGHSAYFDICKAVVETGTPRYMEYYSEARDQWLGFSIVKFDDGYLLNYIDITENKRLALQSARKASELDAIFNGSLSGVYSARAVRNEAGKVVDLVFLRANDAFYRIFKVLPDQIIGRSLLSISGTESQEAFIRFAHEVLRTGTATVHALHYENPERWYEFSMVKLDEEIISVTVNDITDQKQAIARIEEQKNVLDSILKYSPNGLAITQAIRNPDGTMVDARTVLMNEACASFNGIPNEVMLSESFATLSPELLKTDLFKAAVGLRRGESFRTEYELPQTGKWIELAIAKMDDERFINVFTDISQVKSAQVHLERTVEELKRSNANLEHFAYAASHDLKEPIRKIMVYAEQLKLMHSHQLDEQGLKGMERLGAAAGRMKLLVDDLLEYAHVNQGIGGVEEVDLQVKAQKALEDLDLAITETGARIQIDPLPVIRGNKRQLQQVFQNLISNAIKYHKPGEQPEVRVSSTLVKGRELEFVQPLPPPLEQSFYRITVKDNGIGFDQKNADLIFNVFTRLHSSADYSGTGVGLSIVRKAVENHKGFLRARSAPGAGATFEVYLPAGQDEVNEPSR
ncbi:MAG: sensor signal transduction histidine kinase [Flaviaesturariibacter sp.]|nr:sensor signal transduction histidine kinase [Flaviaesturariibacter sp.]